MRYRKYAALFAILLPALLLSGCATTAQISPPTVMAATQADQTATLALRAAREARQKEAAIRAQKVQAAQAFCSRWQRGLRLARRNLMGCAQMPAREQPFCWDAVSQWSADEGTAFTRLSVVLSNTPFYAASRQAATFFFLSQSWISACRKDHESCAAAPQVTRMQSLKAQVNARCQTLPLR